MIQATKLQATNPACNRATGNLQTLFSSAQMLKTSLALEQEGLWRVYGDPWMSLENPLITKLFVFQRI